MQNTEYTKPTAKNASTEEIKVAMISYTNEAFVRRSAKKGTLFMFNATNTAYYHKRNIYYCILPA